MNGNMLFAGVQQRLRPAFSRLADSTHEWDPGQDPYEKARARGHDHPPRWPPRPAHVAERPRRAPGRRSSPEASYGAPEERTMLRLAPFHRGPAQAVMAARPKGNGFEVTLREIALRRHLPDQR